MKPLQLYRKRLIPAECILLKEDTVIEQTPELVLTSWKTLNPKTTFSHGCSCYFLKEGIKLSKMYRKDNTLLQWYCDIVSYDYNKQENILLVTDLLADVILDCKGDMRVVDLDELADAFSQKLLSEEELCHCLRTLHTLLAAIYSGQFAKFQNELNRRGL